MAEPGPLSGQTIGEKYLLGELLGEGGFGAVYKARHILLNRSQAIKVLLERHFINTKFRDRFIREAQTLAALDHPHIVHVDDFGIEKEWAYLVMPFIDRGTLNSILKGRQKPLDLETVTYYLEHICSSLEYAHKLGVVHLDIKPLNLLVHEDGRLLLSDFGLAHLMRQGAVEGGTSLSFGTPSYMSPEHLRGEPDWRSDLYAVAIMLYQMLAGRLPFEGSTPEALIIKHLIEPPPPLRATRPELPMKIDDILGKALAKKSEDRYQHASDLLAAFKAALAPATPQLAQMAKQPISPVKLPLNKQSPPAQPAKVLPHQMSPRIGTTYSSYQGHSGSVNAVAWSPDGKRIVSGGEDKSLFVRDTVNRKNFLFKHSQGVRAVAWSPDGKYIASGCDDKTVQVWDAITKKHLFGHKLHSDRIYAVDWSPDGKFIASASGDYKVNIWSIVTQKMALSYGGHSWAVNAVAWSPDGKFIASASENQIIQIWNASTGSNIATYRGHDGPVNAVDWSPDCRCIVSGSDDRTVRVWEKISGSNNIVYKGHSHKVFAVSWSPDGKHIASGSLDGTVQVWNASTGKRIFTYRHTEAVHALAWSPDGTRIASGSEDGKLEIWQAV